MHPVILTGGPGGGKSSLLQALAERGHEVAHESARAIIRERKCAGLPPRPQPRAFALAILRRDIRQYRRLRRLSQGTKSPAFCDRGLFDALCMLHAVQPLPDSRIQRLRTTFPYCSVVFVLPPWQAIYSCDSERDQNYSEAVSVYEMMCAWYLRCDFQLVEVPRMSLSQRADFILDHLATTRFPSVI